MRERHVPATVWRDGFPVVRGERTAVEEAAVALFREARRTVTYAPRADVRLPGRLQLVLGEEGVRWRVAEARPTRMVLRAGLDLDDPAW